MKEITIAGGGLAGLSLAIALRSRGVPVTVIEAGAYPRHRVCGEFISGVSPDTLLFLGIHDLLDDALHHQSLCWFESNQIIHRDQLPVPALGLSRFALDHRLTHRFINQGGRLITQTRAKPSNHDGIVWAAGRRPRPGPWIGLKAHVRGLTMTADLEMHSGRNGYAGIAKVENEWINICGLFRINRDFECRGRDLLPAYLDAGGSSQLAEQLRAAEWRPDSFSAVAGFELGRQQARSGMLCIGDAESMIPPFTGNGMSMAFQAAETACDSLVSWARGELGWQATTDHIHSMLHRRFRRRLNTAQMLHSILLQPHGRSLLQRLSATHLLPFKPLLSLVR